MLITTAHTTGHKRWMMFVDGENFAIRANEFAQKQGVDLNQGGQHPGGDPDRSRLFLKDVYYWPLGIKPFQHNFSSRVRTHDHAERCYYYTCSRGDSSVRAAAHSTLQGRGFSPAVIHKPSGGRAKGVDISLTKDMLLQAFFGNYEIAVLVSGDGDYVPVVEEVKRFGRRVIVAFFDEANGLNANLRMAADEFFLFETAWL